MQGTHLKVLQQQLAITFADWNNELLVEFPKGCGTSPACITCKIVDKGALHFSTTNVETSSVLQVSLKDRGLFLTFQELLWTSGKWCQLILVSDAVGHPQF